MIGPSKPSHIRRCNICNQMTHMDPERGRIHTIDGSVHESDAKNGCSKTDCALCKFHEPDFITVDATGRKCALIYMNQGGMTLEAIAELYGLTRERIRQIEDSATDKLRRQGIKNPRSVIRKAGEIIDCENMAAPKLTKWKAKQKENMRNLKRRQKRAGNELEPQPRQRS